MPHLSLLLARVVHGLSPVHPLESLRGITTELKRHCPVSSRREEKPAVVRADFLSLCETVVGIRGVRAGREDASLASLDRLACFLVLDDDLVHCIPARTRRRWIDSDAESKVVRPLRVLD